MLMRGFAVIGWTAHALPIPIPIAGGPIPNLIATITTIPKPLSLFLRRRPPPLLFKYQTRDQRLLSLSSSSSANNPIINNKKKSSNSMESTTVKDQQPQQQEEEEEEKKKDNTSPPPAAASKPLEPPEKPLPGDCCGSGCVRCVWDVYYEELEAYNNSLSSSSPNSS